ncbi:MAG: nucleotidyltransferase [Alphaproteobacteria bacterium]|jgi:nucleotidyltransferase substrate binding protein (TIGR01987 family)|nr:nucleotidyltransferase [Alphaproteobacteria bacterium]
MAVSERLAVARQALSRLHEEVGRETPTIKDRDAAILRFIFSFETVWKSARAAMIEFHGPERLQSASPKAIIRESRIAGWLSAEETETALGMADDRNAAVHAYNEAIALDLYPRLAGYADLMDRWLAAIETDANTRP